MKAQPLICVRDVEASSRWDCALLGATSGHGGRNSERVMAGQHLVLQLHAGGVHEHACLGDPALPVGNGAVLWFMVVHFEAAAAESAGPRDRRRAPTSPGWSSIVPVSWRRRTGSSGVQTSSRRSAIG